MSAFGNDLIQSLSEALAHARDDGPALVHAPVTPREVRQHANLTQAQMAPLMGMSLSGYRKWEQGTRRISGPAAALLRVIEREPEAVKRALLSASQGGDDGANDLPISRRRWVSNRGQERKQCRASMNVNFN